MPESKRPDPKRRSSASSRPGKPGKAADSGRGRPGVTARREPRTVDKRPPADVESKPTITESLAVSAEQQSEQRFGSAARRAAILAAVVCVLTLTIAGPVRTYFGQRTEMQQLKASEAQLRAQITELEQQKVKLADPVFIAAQARERLGFVMPGEIPYQVQLPPGTAVPGTPGSEPQAADPDQPWYTALWHTIADEPHGISPGVAPPVPPPAPGAPPPLPAPPGPGG
ncbi:FtsB family cell division protein [Mycobacterium deserti]|uniref:Septum formation initiator family protein n=1 Tax=Mycobacterium deserti TaxID=2978347 RepID=A0ABT2M8J7_9MYCO|nr:septum formation initiator family protein [Mycobacterium deserti]MCT7657316.1 septum formation initiator family protein [Mycobacterium deserti]